MNLKVIHRQLSTYSFSMHRHSQRWGMLGALVILSAATWCEARPINWETLNLSPQQENQMQRLENTWQKKHQEVNSQIERDTLEMRELLPTGDTQRIRQLQNRISTNKMYLMNESMDTFLKKRDMLTPNQRTQLLKLMPSKQ